MFSYECVYSNASMFASLLLLYYLLKNNIIAGLLRVSFMHSQTDKPVSLCAGAAKSHTPMLVNLHNRG